MAFKLFKVAQESKDKKVFDPYAATTIGLGLGSMYAGHKAGVAQDVKELIEEHGSMKRLFDLARKGKLKKSDIELSTKILKEVLDDKAAKEAKQIFNSIHNVAKEGSPVAVRNKYAAIAAGLGLGALGVGLYGAHQHKKSKDQYSPMSVVPEYAFVAGSIVPSAISLIRTVKDRFGKESAHYASLAALPAAIGAAYLVEEKRKKYNRN